MCYKKLLLIPVLCLFGSLYAQSYAIVDPDDPGYPESCTSIMVGKAATTDGSVITTHSCDGNYRTWLRFEPSKTYPSGALEPVYWGLLHNEEPNDMRNVEKKGEIPEDKLADLEDEIQAMTDKFIAELDKRVEVKNSEIMSI